MSNRTLQVAGREFMENLRTKTFWIGIFAVPVIIVLALVIGRIFASAKDTRHYAVLDHSQGQLAGEIEKQARSGDMQRIMRHLLAQKIETAADYRTALQAGTDDLEPDSPLHGFVEILRGPSDEEVTSLLEKKGDGGFLVALFDELKGPIQLWSMEQDPDRLKTAVSGLDQEKYHLVPLSELGELGDSPEENEKALNAAINSGKLFAYFVIGADPVHSFDGCRYVSNNFTDNDLRNWYAQAATRVIRGRRIAEAEIEPKTARWIQESLGFPLRQVDDKGKTQEVKREERANKWMPVGFVYFLWIAVMTATQMLLTNTVEEKSNRIIEVLLSSVSPLQLMAGKIWGIAATGLTIIGSWVIFALIGVAVAPMFLPQLDFPLGDVLGDPLYIASFVGYFLGGYLMYAAVLVAIGSVCNSLKEAQNLMQPVIVVLIIPLIAMIPIVQEPNGTIAKVLTYVPMFTPFVMMNRAGGPPPGWEYALTTALIVVTVIVAFWAAGKVFRIGILMTGKPPRVREILGWLKAPVGTVQVEREKPPST